MVFRAVLRFLIVLVAILLALAFIPGIGPDSEYTPFTVSAPPKLLGTYVANSKLNAAECYLENWLHGPESIAIRGDDIYTGVQGGHVVKIGSKGDITPIVKFGHKCSGPSEERKCGRPLGMRFDRDGSLVVADSYYGIFRVDVDKGTYSTIVSSSEVINGARPHLVDDLDIGSDGAIYWSDASTKYLLEESVLEILAGPTGRLLKYDPKTKRNSVLVDRVHFANGVQLSPNEDYVLVAETVRYRILRHYLKGPNKGTTDVFIDNLPGTPDNLRSNGKGGYYVNLVTVRLTDKFSVLDFVADKPIIRKVAARLLYFVKQGFEYAKEFMPNKYLTAVCHSIANTGPVASLQPKMTIIVELDGNGNVIGTMQNTNGAMASISETAVHPNYFYFGSPYNKCLWRLKRTGDHQHAQHTKPNESKPAAKDPNTTKPQKKVNKP